MNRGARRQGLFGEDADYQVWFGSFAEAHERFPVDVFAYCVMPNHFHLVLRAKEDRQLTDFMRLGTLTHSKRWHRNRGSRGTGAVYQGRYRAFPVQTNRYFYNLCRYVETNAQRACLVARAEDWPWSSVSARCKNFQLLRLQEWPISQPADWVEQINGTTSTTDLERVRRSVARGVPLGDDEWSRHTAEPLGLSNHFRQPGPRRRP